MALSNLRIVGPNAIDGISLTASPSLSTNTPASNLQSALRARVIRSTSLTDQTILGNWNTYPTIGAVAIVRHNLDADCQWQFEMFQLSNQSGTRVYNSGLVSALPVSGWDSNTSVIWLTSPITTALSFRLTLHSTASGHPSAGYFEVGRLFAGPVWSPTLNMTQDDFRTAWAEDTRQSRTAGGSLRSETGINYRVLDIGLEWISDAEHASLMELMRVVGLRKDVLVSAFPGATNAEIERNLMMTAKIVQLPLFEYPYNGSWNASIRFEET